jgi:hypothetical protein
MASRQVGSALVIAALCLAPATGRAVSEEKFQVKTTADLIDLCATPANDALHAAAVNFCEGFVVGAYQYHKLSVEAEGRPPLVCPPNPPPSRDESVSHFISWSQSHKSVLNLPPVEGMFRFLSQTYPCQG